MHHRLLAIAFLATAPVVASGFATPSRELVHAYPPTGPVEVAGAPVASKVLRTMQQHAVPAFTDVLAQHVAHALQGASEAPFAVTRKSRQGGNEAAAAVAAAAADGRTLLLASEAQAAGLSTSTLAHLRPVASVASMPFVLIARRDSNDATVLALIRSRSGRLLVGTAGEKSVGHIAIERLRRRSGSAIEPIPYNGGIAALHAVATRQVSAALAPLPSVLPYLGSGHVRIVAIAEARRHPAIANVPTSAEAGLPALQATGGFGVFAPSGTPPFVVGALNAVLARGLRSAETQEVFADFGLRLEHRYRGITGITSFDGLRPPS
jgi:tripartite-type tricarboxylate transporter receptor subunit TctC